MTDTTNSVPSALVTGSTSGIGAATARALAADGFHVVVTGRDTSRGAQLVTDIEAVGGSARFVPSDLAMPPDTLRTFADSVVTALGGPPDVLVHNAAVLYPVDTPSLTDDQLTTTLAVNITAPHVLTAALAPAMAERGSGSIIVIGSWMASLGSPAVGLYSASKAAEQELARCWAAEFGPRGVRVNTVAPGAVSTPINADAQDVLVQMTAGLPAGRPGRPEEIAAAVAWAASERASYLHGATVAVDGGMTAVR